MSASLVQTGSNLGTGFDAGDVITITVTALNNGDFTGLVDVTAGFANLLPLIQNTGTYSYKVPATTNHQFGVGWSVSIGSQFSWSCVPAGNVKAGQKLAALQAGVTPLVAITSAQAITGAIDGAIADAFSAGGAPFSAGTNGFTINFAAEPQSKVTESAGNALGALAYAGDKGVPAKAPPRSLVPDRGWSLWADVRGTGWRDNDVNNGFDGRQINVTAGFGRKLTSDWLVGIVGGYENFNYDVASLTGTLKGHGGTIGGYSGLRLVPGLRWDAALTWSRVNYDASVTEANGSFDGSRWIASTGLTGTYQLLSAILEPSAKVFALWEKQTAWTDSLANAYAERDFSAGRVSIGGRTIAPWSSGSLSIAPYVGFYGDWRFGSDNISSGIAIIGIENGWSGRATAGLSIAQKGGGTLTLGGEYGGLGADYKMWTGQARLHWPF
jgi:hypothetical protein